MSGLQWTPDVSIYRQPWRESTGACLQAPAGEGMTMQRRECEECGGRAVWAWQARMANSPTYLCDDDAATMDLDELTEL
jgi:hypothetical protein